jgi:hypothetical protein
VAGLTLDDSDMLSMLVTYRSESRPSSEDTPGFGSRNKYFAFMRSPAGCSADPRPMPTMTTIGIPTCVGLGGVTGRARPVECGDNWGPRRFNEGCHMPGWWAGLWSGR